MNKMTFIGWIGLTALACQSNTEGYQIKGNIEGAGNGIAIMTLPVGREEPTTGDTVKMENGVFTFTGKLEAPSWVSIQVCPDKEKPASCGFIGENNTITLAGKWADVLDQYGYRSIPNVNVTGSLNEKVFQEISNVREKLMQEPRFKEYAEVQAKLNELHNGEDKEAFYKYQAETEAITEEFSNEVRKQQKELILKNDTIEAVAYYLNFLQNDMELTELEQVFKALSPKVQNSSFAKDVREEIAARIRVQPGMPAPDFTLETPDGTKLSLSDLRGKYVILDFWASWCRPCRASFPEMKKLYAEYHKKGVEILGVTNDSRKNDWLKALEEDQLPWLQVIDEFPIPHTPAKVATLYAIPYLPTLMLIAPDGKIVGKAKDKHELKTWLDERLAKKK